MSVSEELYPFQRVAVDFVVGRAGAALFCDPGTGKTHITAGVIERLMSGSTFSGLCVVPLANVETTWVRLMARVGIEGDRLIVCRSWAEFVGCGGRSRLLLLHYEAIRGPLVKKLVRSSWDLVVYDESQRIKARGSKASRAAARFSRVTHRVILSGTPVEQAPQDLWAQLRFVCPEVLGARWADFEGRWLRRTGFMGYDREFLWERLPEFLDLIRPHVMRVTKDEVLDLPPIEYVREVVPLLGDQRRVYDEIERDATTILVNGTEIICDLAITKLVRLQQVVGGFIRDEDGHSHAVGKAKSRRLKAVIRREHGSFGPVIIFCKYREEIASALDAVYGALGHSARVGLVTGKTRRTRVATIEAFQRGEIDGLVCQQRTGGVGLDLQMACVVVFYSATFSYIDFDQAVSRVHRNGQTRPVRIVLLQAQNTVDRTIYSALLMKRNVSEQVLEDHTRRKMKPMAKKDKAPAAAAPEKKAEKAKPTPPPQPPKPKYGVPELAEALGVKQSSVRVKLRSAKIPKNGKLYGWDSKAEMQEVVNKLRASAKKGKAKDADETEEEEDSDEE